MRQSKIQRYLKAGMLPQLRVLEAVARHGSFTRAAAELHIAQPTASLHIKKLTETVGLPLVEQVGRRVVPTAAGHALGATCTEIMGALARLDETLSDLRELRSGSLRIAASTSEEYVVPRLLAEFVRRHRGIEASIQVLPCAAVLARLAEDMDDLYVCTHPPASGEIVAERMFPNPILVYARRDHPLAGLKSVPLARFAQEPLLVPETGSGSRAVVERVFAERNLRPRVRMELGSNEAIKEAILSGIGVAVLARYAVGFDSQSEELAVLDVEGFPIERYWHFVYPAAKHLSPAARAFIEMVKCEANSVLAGRRALSPPGGTEVAPG
jgi:DNA-binding transcriptional LysR family regulator